MLECLPHTYVDPEQLDTIDPTDNKRIYITNILAEHMVKRTDPTDTTPFVEADYFKDPTGYESNFSRFYDKITFLIQCMYWSPEYPRCVTEEELC